MQGSQIFTRPLGLSVEGREIVAYANFDLAVEHPLGMTLLIGGQHGDEPATVRLLESFHARYLGGPEIADTPTVIIAPANPDGLIYGTRVNARGVDLNRNCGFNWRPTADEPPGPSPWSEPEICALRDFILGWQPAKIVSLHWALAEVDADGAQSTGLAEAMWAAMTPEQKKPYRLRVTEIGRGQRRLQETYAACPGSLGQWCGYGLLYPDDTSPAMITLELPYDPWAPDRPEVLSDDHLPQLRILWARDAKGYLEAVEPGVHAMLLAACRFQQPVS